MADKDLLTAGEGSALERLVETVIDRIEGRKTPDEAVAAEAEKARIASVVALNKACEAEEKKIRESAEFKANPQVGAVALRFGWTFEEFLENLARAGAPRLVSLAA